MTHWIILGLLRETGRYLTQSNDRSHNKVTTQNANNKFNYITIADRLKMVRETTARQLVSDVDNRNSCVINRTDI